jgi:hypothetical protein
MPPDNAQMNKPSYAKVLNALCLRDAALVKKDGSVNHNEVARRTGVPQPTVTRHLNGAVDSPRGANCLKFCRYFGVTMDQLAGNQKIPGLLPAETYYYQQPGRDQIDADRMQVSDSGHPQGDDALWEQVIPTFMTQAESLSNEQLVQFIDAIGRSVSPGGAMKLAQILLDHARRNLPPDEE